MRSFHFLLLCLSMFLTLACGGGGGGGGTPPPPGSGTTNTPPTASAGMDQVVTEGDTVQLAGSGSDAEGPVTFAWTQTSGPAVMFSNAAIASPTFVAPMVTSQQQVVLTLTVTDSNNVSVTDSVTITVGSAIVDNPPTADAGVDQTVLEGTQVQLAGSGMDAEGAVTYAWMQTAGPAVTLSNAAIANPTFTAPMVNAQQVLQFTLTVTDTNNATATDTVSITVNDTPPVGGTATYLFYSNDLRAVDPANPGAPILIEPAANLVTGSFGTGTPNELIRTGDYDATTNTISNEHYYAVIYAKTDGRFYRVDARKSGSLTPVQVSSETQAHLMCVGIIGGTAHRPDSADPENSQYLYALPGGDGNCETADDVWKMLRLGMTATDAPVIAKKPVEALYDLTSGAINGWLVHDAGMLSKCDANFANCAAITTVTAKVNSSIVTKLNHYLLDIDADVYVYDANTNTLSASVFTVPAGTFRSIAASDGTTVFFGHANQLYSFPADGSVGATSLVTETDEIQLRVVVTANKVVYVTGTSGTGKDLRALPKAGGTPITLASTTGTNNMLLFNYSQTDLFYNVQDISITGGTLRIAPVLAGRVDEDGNNKVETATTAWVGFTVGTDFDLNDGSNLGVYTRTMHLAEGFDIAGTSGGYAGAMVKSFDVGALTATPVDLGMLPNDDKFAGFNCFGYGDDVMCSAAVEVSPAPTPPALPIQNDMFYLHAVTANSLTRVTDTASQSEIPLF